MFEQESLLNESMEKYIWNQPLEHPKMVSTKWENTTPFFRTNPARHKMMVYAGHVPTHFMPEISRGITNMTPTTASPQNDQTSQKSRHTETCVRIIFLTSLENEEQLGCSKIDLWLWHPKNRGSKKLPSHQEMSSANCLNTTVTCFTLLPKDYFHTFSHYFHPHAMFYSLLDCSPSDIGGRLGSSLLHDGVGPSPPPANTWSTPLPVIAGTKFPPFDLKVQCHKE